MYLRFLLVLLVTISLTSCTLINKIDYQNITVIIDPTKFIDTDLAYADPSITLKIYILRKSYIFNARSNNKLTNELKTLDVPNLSRYRVYSCQIYNIVPGELIRDRLIITKDTALIVSVIKTGEKVLSKKFTPITVKELNMLNIELVGAEIRINN
jgi:hypothetical protein